MAGPAEQLSDGRTPRLRRVSSPVLDRLRPFLVGAPCLVLAGCSPGDGQRLLASGEVLQADGSPARDLAIDTYAITFHLQNGVAIERRFESRGPEDGVVTDGAGLFRIDARDVALSYDWERDEWVCEDVCTTWETTCALVTDYVCVDDCEVVTYDECWDECWEDCESVCWDETVCDAWGDCWTETTCDEDCTSSCDTVCGTVTEEVCEQDCWTEENEVCEDVCLEIVEECGWVTRTYTSHQIGRAHV